MTELSGWKNEYAKLREYIAANPEIVITRNEISIPQPLRDEFYRLFDEARKALAEDHLNALPISAQTLSERYVRIEEEVKQMLGLENIVMPIDLHIFLHNPKESLIRSVYNSLFDFLQGKVSEEEFEQLAEANMAASSYDLFRLGYERWAGLEIIRLLEPEEAFFVDLDEEFKPYLRELKEISFGRQTHHPTMRVPEFVVRSRKFNKLVAIKMALAIEINEYLVSIKPAVRPKKRTGDTSIALAPRAVLLSFLKSEKDIPVYADIFDGTRVSPDWLIEYVDGEELFDTEALQQIRRHIEILNPKFGCSLIVLGEMPELDVAGMPENVRLVSTGLDISGLSEMMSVLSA